MVAELLVTDVARSVVCDSVCVLVTRVSCAKTDEPIVSPFGGDGSVACASKEPKCDSDLYRLNYCRACEVR